MADATKAREGHVTIACPFCDTLNDVTLARYADKPKCGSCHKPLHLDRPVSVRGDQFDRTVLGAGVPVLVDFYADWCGPCRAMAPTLDQVAQDLAGEALIVKLNTDAAPEISQRYGVRSIPFFTAFKGGEVSGTLVGMQNADGLKNLVRRET